MTALLGWILIGLLALWGAWLVVRDEAHGLTWDEWPELPEPRPEESPEFTAALRRHTEAMQRKTASQ